MPFLCMDSLLEDVPDTIGGTTAIKMGHAIAAMILSRLNLTFTEADTIENPDMSNPYLPHWERKARLRKAIWAAIAKIPVMVADSGGTGKICIVIVRPTAGT